MQGDKFKQTMTNSIDRLNSQNASSGMISFYRGAITALVNCGVMSDTEFWNYEGKLNKIQIEIMKIS